ncbi:unnamed protein product [Schistosoma mattheei]|uniref:Uncharacterized protein n=2 Tax=Schistosoma TaxID=6181 RepID=A0A3P8DTT1_9TREM|nr:unnamed protein product [Schistosoma margrebowiei]VDP74304.1 unnamed protein product [Schistosoma mattheei]
MVSSIQHSSMLLERHQYLHIYLVVHYSVRESSVIVKLGVIMHLHKM